MNARTRRKADAGGPPCDGTRIGDALRWAIDASSDPALAAADWLASDIDPARVGAVDLLTNPNVSLIHLRQAKAAFKAMRIVGETPADRRVGARPLTRGHTGEVGGIREEKVPIDHQP